jgi:hypothetical protein
MSEDIIRSTKEHEVVIPEGSINAKSKSSSVGTASLEPEHVEKVSNTQEIVDRRVSVDGAQASGSENVKLDAQPSAGENRVLLPEEKQEENRIRLPDESIDENRIPVISDVVDDGDNVLVVSEKGVTENRVKLPANTQELHDPVLVPESEAPPPAPSLPSEVLPEHHSETADVPQVAASLVDTRREEFAGRVVKLREEVDHLNQRLDRLEK